MDDGMMDDGLIRRENTNGGQHELAPALARRIRFSRDHFFGLWIAAQLGISGPSAEIYAAEIAADDLCHPGDTYMIERVAADLKAHKIRVAEHELLAHLCQAEVRSRRAILGIESADTGNLHRQ
jgi:hypothetical protein